ncbi:MAG: MopE-related protein [Myxococcota bacterium]
MIVLLPAALASTYTVSLSGPEVTSDAVIAAYEDEDWPVTEDGLELYASAWSDYDRRSLVAFPTLVGDAEGQVPAGSLLVSASLVLTTWEFGGEVEHVGMWTLTEPWIESATWEDRGAGSPWAEKGAGSASRGEGCGQVALVDGAPGTLSFDVVTCIEGWVTGDAPNYGWIIAGQGEFGREERVYFWAESSEAEWHPPVLTVVFEAADRDADGADLWEDCDDADAARAPGLAEVCGDGVDQDCDGADPACGGDDTGVSPGDDTGAVGDPTVDGDHDRFTPDEGDCDDGNALVHPGRDDDDCDGVDSDCDDATDEDCVVQLGGAGCSCGEPDAAWLLFLIPLSRRRSSSAARPTRTSPS